MENIFKYGAIFTKRNVDQNQNPISEPFIEQKQVMDNHSCIILNQLPDPLSRVQITGFIEVTDVEDLTPTTFKVDYNNGIVYFHTDNIGRNLTVNYEGVGFCLISASRVIHKYDQFGNVIETIEEFIEKGKEYIQAIELLGGSEGVTAVVQRLEDDIETGNALDVVLKEDVVIIDQKIAEAEEEIVKIDNITGNYIGIIYDTDWVYNNTNERYEYTLEHNLESDSLILNMVDNVTKKPLFQTYDMIDKNSILFYVDEIVEARVVISARYYKATVTISDDIAQEVVEARKSQPTLLSKVNQIDNNITSLNTKFDEVNAGNYFKIIYTDDWVLNEETEKYEYTVNHMLNSKNILVNIVNNITGLPIYPEYKITGVDSVLFYSDELVEQKVIIASKHYKAVMEISDNIAQEVLEARGSFDTLEERLDSIIITEDYLDEDISLDISELQTDYSSFKTSINEQTNNIALNVDYYYFLSNDFGIKLQQALNSSYKEILIPKGYHDIYIPLSVPYNSGKKIKGVGGIKGTVLNFHIEAGNSDRGAIEYIHDVTNQPNYAGITIEDLHIIGNDSICHGIYLQDVSHPILKNVIVEGFIGAGILLDKCQDGIFEVNVQNCGRTSGNINLLADRSDNSKTLYSPIHFISTISDDHNNMLRFNNCQIEQNKVSPYIWVKDSGAIGLWFNETHAEVRNSNDFYNFDFLISNGADCEFNGMALSPTFRNGFILKGYGTYLFDGGRSVHNISHLESGVNGTIIMNNVNCGNLNLGSVYGNHRISNSSFYDINISYPAGEYKFNNCYAEDVTIDHAGAGYAGVNFINCTLNSYTTDANAKNQLLKDSRIISDINAQGIYSSVENCDLSTATITNINIIESSFIKKKKIIYDSQPPIYGQWSKGDICYNTSPSAGGYMGWVCVVSGGSGTWKGFGAIQL